MASDLSSACTDDIDIFEEKEEGELSLEDVSSSEECHPNYRNAYRNPGRCSTCTAIQICAPWCQAARVARKNHNKQDAVHGKENRRRIKEAINAVPKHMVATLQEKNDDLVPISSDSDMEIVGLPGNSKQIHTRSKNEKVRKRRKKKRSSHNNVVRIENSLSPSQAEPYPVEVPLVKKVRSGTSSRCHNREQSPPRYTVTRSPSLTRTVPKSPSRRYRATRPMKLRSPPRRSRSPITRVNPVEKKSPRKLRSPRRSPGDLRSPVRTTLFKETRHHSPPTTSQTHIDIKLLQKVRRLESVGGTSTKEQSKNKEHSSLKEKLSNMMKNQVEASHEKPIIRKQNNSTNAIDNSNNNNDNCGAAADAQSDDEDDIEVLRRLALETKQKKAETKIEETKIKKENVNVDDSDDNDIEANELRILALRSAIMKKHEKRVTRGVKSKKISKSTATTRVESPFDEIFLDDIYISGDENKTENTNFSPIPDYESNHPEDMDIDTDVEREKEKDYFMPYSPTDDLTGEIPMDAEIMNTNGTNNTDEQHISNVTSRENNNRKCQENTWTDYIIGVDTPYSPSPLIQTPNFHKSANDAIESRVDTQFSPLGTMLEIQQSEKSHEQFKKITNTESPYSPTDTPILDPNLFPIFPNLPVMQPSIESTERNEENASTLSKIAQVHKAMDANIAATNHVETDVAISQESKDNNLLPQEVDKCKSPSRNDRHFDLPMREKSLKAIDTLNKLPEVDLDGSPLVPVSKELESVEDVIPIVSWPEMVDAVNDEPLYLRCLAADVTKDTSSKIPTLTSRTLVPANILKTNKQLQQPLPQKKIDIPAEPSFKSAEMRPVSVEETHTKLPTMFKPIKLCPISKKPQVMTTMAAAAFNVSFGDDSLKETKTDDETADQIVDEPTLEQETKATTSHSPSTSTSDKSPKLDNSELKKKYKLRLKKRRKLRDKRKSSDGKSSKSDFTDSSGKKKKAIVGSMSEILTDFMRAQSEASNAKSGDKVLLKDKRDVQREASKAKSEIGQADEKKKKKSRRGGKKFQQRKLLSIAREAERKSSSDLDTTNSSFNNTEQTVVDKSDEKEQMETNENKEEQSKAVEGPNKVDESEIKRSSSIDDDEEALRALLLASLPKRTKPVEIGVATPPENPATSAIDLPITINTTTSMSIENSANKPNTSTAHTPTPVNPFPLSTQSSNPISAISVTTTENTGEASKMDEIQSSNAEISPLTPRKRTNLVTPKGPPKKVVKKASPVITSTKVVNNAKKYQVALMQKKLNPQRTAINYAAPIGSRNITLNNVRINDSTRPSSPKISSVSKTQSLIINLGSDTDSDENDNQSQPPTTTSSNSGNCQEENRQPLAVPQTPFEIKIEQFLKFQREKCESVKVSKTPPNSTPSTSRPPVASTPSPVTATLSGLYNTPLAVRRHLPMSQQEEYRRLKQQIAEREREKLRKTMVNGSASSQKSPCTPPGPLSPASTSGVLQKAQTANTKAPGVANELVSSSLLAPSNKDKTSEKPIVQKKIESIKANDVRLTVNSINASKIVPASASNKEKTSEKPIVQKKMESIKANDVRSALNSIKASKIVPAIVNKPMVKPLVALSKVNSSLANITCTASGPKGAVKIGPKGSSTPSPNGVPSAMPLTSASRSSLKNTEMLTIQIPNDKIQSGSAITGISRGESSSPPNGRNNVGMLKILTKEQLNSRFVQIKVKQGSAGRTVTVGGSPGALSHEIATTSFASSSPTPRHFSAYRNDKTDKKPTCDTSLIVNQSILTRRKIDNSDDSMLADSEASTLVLSSHTNNTTVDSADASAPLVLSRNGGKNRKDRNANSNASTRVINHENARNDRTTIDFEASTLVLSRNEENSRNNKTADSDTSTLILDHENPHNDRTTIDSEASTLVLSRNEGNACKNKTANSDSSTLSIMDHETDPHNDRTIDSERSTLVSRHDISEGRESPGLERTDESEDGSTLANGGTVKLTKSQSWEKFTSDVKKEVETLTALPDDQQRSILMESQENLVAKRNMVLDDLTEMSGCLRQWEVEREIQTRLMAEVRRLREQLRTAEKHLHEQRRQMNGMGPKVTKAHAKINHGRRECYKLSRICHGLGIKLVGEEYKVPDTGEQLLNERLKEVAVHTRQLSKKKVASIDSLNNSRDTASPTSSVCSDTTSEFSYIERSSNPTASSLLSCESTNSLASENDLDSNTTTEDNTTAPPSTISEITDANGKSKENSDTTDCEMPTHGNRTTEESSAPPETSIAIISEITDVKTEENEEKTAETHAPSEEKKASNSEEEKHAQKRDNEESSSSEKNAQMLVEEEPDLLKFDAQTNSIQVSNSSEYNTNCHSDVPATISINTQRYQDIPKPGTSNSDSHRKLLSSDGRRQPPAKFKIEEYRSVLTHLRASRSANPDGILCPYELMGTCSDGDCQFYHLDSGHCQ